MVQRSFAFLRAIWMRLVTQREFAGRCSTVRRLREDIGLTEYDTKSPTDWIEEAMRKHIRYY
jgi:hypothetical protein